MEPILGVTKDDQKFKPQIYKLYDFTKGGADIIDQKMGMIPRSRKAENGVELLFFIY